MLIKIYINVLKMKKKGLDVFRFWNFVRERFRNGWNSLGRRANNILLLLLLLLIIIIIIITRQMLIRTVTRLNIMKPF
jgi:hypothetical protein